MAQIRLLTAPVLLPPDPEAKAASTSLVPARGLPSNSQSLAKRDPSIVNDDYVWSVAPGSDGSYLFYALSSDSRNSAAFGQRQSSPYAASSAFNFSGVGFGQVAARYAFYASMGAPASGRMLDVYA